MGICPSSGNYLLRRSLTCLNRGVVWQRLLEYGIDPFPLLSMNLRALREKNPIPLTEFLARRSRNPRALNHGFTPMDTEGKVRFPDPAGNGSEFLFRRRVQQRLLRASASLRENRLFLLSFSIPTSPSRSPAEAQGCGELSGFSMETGRFPPSVFNGVEKSAAQRGKRWQVIFRFPRPYSENAHKKDEVDG